MSDSPVMPIPSAAQAALAPGCAYVPQAAPMSPALLRLVRCYENLAPATLTTELAAVYASQAHFRDPFNDVRGLPAILVIFDDMFHRTHAPRFVITGHVEQGNQAFLTWDFHFGLGRAGARQLRVQGCSQLQFDAQGRVTAHRDHWDVAGELYAQLPLLGVLMRALARRLSAQ